MEPLGRRRFLAGALAGGAGGVLLSTGAHALTHLTTEEDDHGEDDHGEDSLGHHVDVGFCTDMAVHHVQAIAMCERVLGFDTGDGNVQAAATEVIRNQSVEVGMMWAWLADWGESTAPPERVMAWMAMDDAAMDDMTMEDTAAEAGIPLADMPGYASPEEMSALAQAEPGVEKGRLWLELMRAHHVGGVAMAEAAAELASTEKVRRLARTQAEVQAYEIAQYDVLLAGAYA